MIRGHDGVSTSSSNDSIESRLLLAAEWWGRNGGGGPTSTLTGGGAVGMVEAWFTERSASVGAALVASGTQALIAALIAAGVRRGDRVVIAAYGWPGPLAACCAVGAVPTFADVGEHGVLTASTVGVAADVHDIAAVVVVHLHGYPADVAAIRAACPQAVIIEDCSYGLGAMRDGREVGRLGDFACWSLRRCGFVDGAEGGVIACRTDRQLADVVRVTQHPFRQILSGISDPTMLGHIARLHPAAALLAAAQLDHVTSALAAQRQQASWLSMIARHAGIQVVVPEPSAVPSGVQVMTMGRTPAGGSVVLSLPMCPESPAALFGLDVPPMAQRWCAHGRSVLCRPEPVERSPD